MKNNILSLFGLVCLLFFFSCEEKLTEITETDELKDSEFFSYELPENSFKNKQIYADCFK